MAKRVVESVDIQFKSDDQINTILNSISDMYKDPYRVLYEFVQNSIDSAEELRRANKGIYQYPINIYLLIDKKNKEFSIVDNCKGMDLVTLRGLANKIFDSKKKSLPWAIGKFGYGIHSFRAFFKLITFVIKQREDNKFRQISFEKNKVKNNYILELDQKEAPFSFESGTFVKLSSIDTSKYKFSNIDENKIKEAIELHCENILRERDLNIFVGVGIKKIIKCEPFDYDLVSGQYYNKEIKIMGKSVNVFLKIVDKPLKERKVRFVCKNFRINEIANCESFRRSSSNPDLWDHPNLIGYVEVGDLISPELERSDFPPTKERYLLYEELKKIEPELRELLEEVLEKTKSESLGELSNVLEDIFSQISKRDDLLFREALRKARLEESADFQVGGEGGGDSIGEGGPLSAQSVSVYQYGEGSGSGLGPNREGTGTNIGEGKGGIGINKLEEDIEVKKRRTSGFTIKFHQ